MEDTKNSKCVIEQLRERKCIYCNQPLKQYTLISVTIPPETLGASSSQFAHETSASFPFYFWGQNSFQYIVRIILMSECECGNISWWTLNKSIWDALTSDELTSEGYGITWVYNKEELENILNKSENDKYTSELKNIIANFRKGE